MDLSKNNVKSQQWTGEYQSNVNNFNDIINNHNTHHLSVSIESGIQVDPNRKKHYCELCNKIFYVQDEYRKHRRTLHPEIQFWTCKICNQYSEHKRWLKRHIQNVHTQKRYYCTLCKAKFEGLDAKKHYKTHCSTLHINEIKIKCELCDKVFSSNQSKKNHFRRLHIKETLFKCQFCGLIKISSSDLQSHILTHSKEKPAICDICGKGFHTKSEVKTHQRTHSENKQHLRDRPKVYCDICGRKLSSLNRMINHMRHHTDEKPFSCSVCDTTFRNQFTKSYHELKKHKIAPSYDCDVCKECFAKRKLLRLHQMSCYQSQFS